MIGYRVAVRATAAVVSVALVWLVVPSLAAAAPDEIEYELDDVAAVVDDTADVVDDTADVIDDTAAPTTDPPEVATDSHVEASTEAPAEASVEAPTITSATSEIDAPAVSEAVEPAPPGADTSPRPRITKAAEHFTFGGFVQVDYLRKQISQDQLSDGTQEPLNENAFLLRNARLGLDGDWKYVGVTAWGDFFSNGGTVRPTTFDAHAQLPGKDGAPPIVQLRAGLLRVPFGFENYNQSDVQRFFGERTHVMHAFVPGLFDVGASLQGHVWALDWVVAVHNGQPVGAPGFGFRDPNNAKDYSGRLVLAGTLFSSLHASFGLSFLKGTGFSPGTAPTKDSFDWADLDEDGRVTVAELIPIPGSAGRAAENFKRWGLGADLQVRAAIPRIGELMVYSEMAVGSNLDRAVAIADPVLLGRDQRGIGWYVGVTQALTRHASVGVRFDQYYPNLDALEAYNGLTVNTRRKFQSVTPALAGHLHQGPNIRARLLLEYVFEENTLGRDAQGRPAQLDNDTLRIRAEVAF
ncbi:MAG: hypothetical protein JKY37_26825 [Nannocystaceae bacterium]|nr:hypothetical protein [Nannocystaceae bacterium]